MFGGKYESFFNDHDSEKKDGNKYEDTRSNTFNEEEDGTKSRSITGIAWNRERYYSILRMRRILLRNSSQFEPLYIN